MLFRASEISHAIFTATRYAAFDTPIAGVGNRDDNGRLVVRKDHIKGDEFVFKLHSSWFANEDDAMLMSTWLAGGPATIRMFAFLTGCIKGILCPLIDHVGYC
jgi:hypothetical protein